MSPLVDTTSDIKNNNIKQGPTDVTSDKIDAANDKDDINEECPDPSPKKSPYSELADSSKYDTGEFRARAASAGQQARAHVSQIVARFRNRSNTNTDERDRKRYKIVGHVSLNFKFCTSRNNILRFRKTFIFSTKTALRCVSTE